MKILKEKWHTHLDITTVCCNSCMYCSRYMRHTPNKDRGHMSLEYFEKALDTLLDWPNRIGLMGGEPTLHPDFARICEIMRDPKRNHPNYHRLMNRYSLFTTGGPSYEKLREVIGWTFHYVEVFEHNPDQTAICMHQPTTLAIQDVIEDANLREELINDCWVDKTWCATINEYGAYFCEVAAAIDRVTNKGGRAFALTNDWWMRTPDDADYKKQLELCQLCGMPVPVEREVLATGKERISEGLFNILKECGSPGLTEEKCIVIKDKFTKEDIERNRIGWHPGQFRQDIYPEGGGGF